MNTSAEIIEGKSLLDINIGEVKAQLMSRGAVIFKGLAPTQEEFVKFTESVGGEFMPYLGGAYAREAITPDNTVVKVNSGEVKISLHGEQHYKKNKADLLWFYCVNPPSEGGETTICDGVEFYQALSPSTRELFETKKIKYTRWLANGFWQKIFKSESSGVLNYICGLEGLKCAINADHSVTTEYIVSAIIPTKFTKQKAFVNNMMVVLLDQEALPKETLKYTTSFVSFEDDTPIPTEVVQELVEVAERLTYPIKWEKGDFCVLDNHRFMHGRNAFYGQPHRQIITRMAKLV